MSKPDRDANKLRIKEDMAIMKPTEEVGVDNKAWFINPTPDLVS